MVVLSSNFQLIETMLYNDDTGIPLLPYHHQRLTKALKHYGSEVQIEFDKFKELIFNQIQLFIQSGQIQYFNFYSNNQLIKKLLQIRVRLLTKLDGTISIECSNQPPMTQEINKLPEVLVVLDKKPISKENPYLLYKTTQRQLYNEARELNGVGIKNSNGETPFDVILYNSEDEITETSIANLALKKDGIYLTPPLECGLLDGTQRKYLLSTRDDFKVSKITRSELLNAVKDGAELIGFNAVRGIFKMKLKV